ncbi:hypothetical protein SLEP1_g57262 [Rubroshorea leprosula]|uniref:S-locus glycoprotein domain-containing protein n=1 Tax=Rubroshorea leprosula TaxID=152421 RepID=A0AAV5MKX5_9ROSI|nr:hypothetical protein SLEP1_g57262 [Rubroshorea leprosula]
MSPKFSDFGMARTFGREQSEGNTQRVVGTYGFMVLEYGQFSVKSYVFSFRILLWEIISGKKNKGSYHLNHRPNLIGNAYLNHTSSRVEGSIWKEDAETWILFSHYPRDDCDNHGTCGAYGTCVKPVLQPCQYLIESFQV